MSYIHCSTSFCLFVFRISADNIATVWTFAKAESIEELQNACLQLIRLHFDEFAERGDFILSLPLEEFKRVLTGSSLCPKSEDVVFEVVEKWLMAKPKEEAERCHPALFACLNPSRVENPQLR